MMNLESGDTSARNVLWSDALGVQVPQRQMSALFVET